MSLKYRDSQGNETPVAGLNGTSGELVPSVSLYQTGSFEVPALSAGGWTSSGTISLQTPFSDTDYIITCDFASSSLVAGVIHKTASNFEVTIGNIDPSVGTSFSTCYWKAFKLMTDESRALDETHIEQNTANFAPSFSTLTSYAVGDYVTYNNILYRCTTAHTAGVWVSGHFTQVTVGGELNDKSSMKPVAIINTTTLGLTAQSTYTFMDYYRALVSHGFGVGHYILEIQPNDNARVYVNGDFNKTGTVSMNACTLEVNILATSATRAYQMLATALMLGTAGLTAMLSASTGASTSALRSCVNVLAQD